MSGQRPQLNVRLIPGEPDHYGIYSGIFNDASQSRGFASVFRSVKYTKIFHENFLRASRSRVYTVLIEQEPAGFAGLYDIDSVDKSAGILYGMCRAVEGRGAATAAVGALAKAGFEELGLNTLNAWTAEDNAASMRVLEKNGFKRAGLLRESHCSEGRFINRILFDLTRKDFNSICPL